MLPVLSQTDAGRFVGEGKWREALQKWRFLVRLCKTYPRVVDFTKQRDLLGLVGEALRAMETVAS